MTKKKNEYISSLITAAKNIRIELKKAFPTVKFSVTTKRYAGGNHIDVSWTDGITHKKVEDIIDKYRHGEFNGMIDGYDYKKDRSFNKIFGGSDYVFLHSSVKHPQLLIVNDLLNSAKNIEIELKAHFPSTEFKISVEDNDPISIYEDGIRLKWKKEPFIRIEWKSEPLIRDVRKIIEKHGLYEHTEQIVKSPDWKLYTYMQLTKREILGEYL